MKMTTQLVWVICVGIVGFVGLIIGLAVLADWSDGAIIGMGTAFGAILVNTIIAIRNQQTTSRQLDTITEQTNGLSHDERRLIADEAADQAAVKVVQAFRRGGDLR